MFDEEAEAPRRAQLCDEEMLASHSTVRKWPKPISEGGLGHEWATWAGGDEDGMKCATCTGARSPARVRQGTTVSEGVACRLPCRWLACWLGRKRLQSSKDS